MSDKIREALEGMLAIHDEPAGFQGKYGRALDEAIAAQKVKIDQRIAAARAALAQQPTPAAVPCPVIYDPYDRMAHGVPARYKKYQSAAEQPDTVKVRRELLEKWERKLSGDNGCGWEDLMPTELQALLAGGDKP